MAAIFMVILGLSAGLIIAGGVFTALTAVGLVPRFAGKTHTGNHIFLYEEMVVTGAILGTIISVFYIRLVPLLESFRDWIAHPDIIAKIEWCLQILIGFFFGIFVGCVALAIAEMLDSIPIFSRRINFRHGLGITVIFMALGKVSGSFIYFYFCLFH